MNERATEKPLWIQVLVWVQLLAIVSSVVAAVVEIETIVPTGAIFSVVGLIIVGVSYERSVTRGFYFGLCVPTIAVLCFCIIYGLQLSPRAAAFPISCLLSLAATLAVPLAVLAVRESQLAMVRSPKMQFGIRFPLGLMAFSAVTLGLLRVGPLPTAIWIFVTYAAICCYVAWRFHRRNGVEVRGALGA